MTEVSQAGLLSIDKPAGWTSHDVVARARRLTGVRRLGHTGTLDPMATGVLVLCLGQATRLAEYLMGQPKRYLAEITLGSATDTYDATGQVTTRSAVPLLGREVLESALAPMRGEIMQTPPPFSAIKQDGQPLYKRARRGEAVLPEPRPVTIYELQLLEYNSGILQVRVACSAGTYIRSIAHDLGQTLGCGAHLSSLRRTAVGSFAVDDAVTLNQLAEAVDNGHWLELLQPVDAAVSHLEAVTLPADQAARLLHGQSAVVDPDPPTTTEDPVRAYGLDGRLLAIVRLDREQALWRPVKVLARSDPTA